MISSCCITKVSIAIRAGGQYRDREVTFERLRGSNTVKVTLPAGPKTKRPITLSFTADEVIAALRRQVSDG